ncbi:MAG: winged helix-turn-helix transcriptional regulator [Coriobacteriales bacterium]
MRVLIALCQAKTVRFNELRRMLPGISNNMLSQCLREFEKYKIVQRKRYEEIPPRVEYSLTELGRELHPAVHLLNEWGYKVQKANGIDSDG